MLLKLSEIIKDYNLKIRGVIHIGAHWGQEYPEYAKHRIENIIFFEPVKSNYEMLLDGLPQDDNIKVFNLALGNEAGTKEMFTETANKGQSCSFLEPYKHLKTYPYIKFYGKEKVEINKLDNIVFDRALYNMINIDVQGYEIEVFKGGVGVLDSIDIIYAEVNFDEVYKNCCRVEDVDSFLDKFGFVRVTTEERYRSYGWGDALYLKFSVYNQK